MTEKKIIQQLRLLKNIKPDNRELHDLRNIIDSVTQTTEKQNFFFWIRKVFGIRTYNFPAAIITAVVPILLLIVVSHTFITGGVGQLMMTTNMLLASNQYEKAKYSLTFAKSSSGTIGENKQAIAQDNLIRISQAVTQANTQLSLLKLSGEKGKYTMKQCLTLYEEYHAYLEDLQTTISNIPITNSNRTYVISLRNTVTSFDKLSEEKLHLYKVAL